jgi:DNA-binding MarR family transcriptional regulator
VSSEVTKRLGYLLKHAQQAMHELNDAALAQYDINGRELGVLAVLAGQEPASQQEAAQRLGIDRTTMVTILDTLEGKGLVSRHPSATDRRRNVVELTAVGQRIYEKASAAAFQAEETFLDPLKPEDREGFRQALRAVVLKKLEVRAQGGA